MQTVPSPTETEAALAAEIEAAEERRSRLEPAIDGGRATAKQVLTYAQLTRGIAQLRRRREELRAAKAKGSARN
jgi:hypothetical protein